MIRIREALPGVWFVERNHWLWKWRWTRLHACASQSDAIERLAEEMDCADLFDNELQPAMPPPLPPPAHVSEAGRMGLDLLRELEALTKAKADMADVLSQIIKIASDAHHALTGRAPTTATASPAVAAKPVPKPPADQPSPAAIPRPAAMSEERKRELREKFKRGEVTPANDGPKLP